MKFTMLMKDPDGVHDAFRKAVKEILTPEELEDEYALNDRLDEEQDKMKKFIQYGEYVKIEVDTEEQTMNVVPFRNY